eukprot:6469390-Amphidinium_carterae.1
MQEGTMRDHLVLHSGRLEAYDQMRREIFDVFRSRQQLGGSGPAPMQLDALKGKDKGWKGGKSKGKDKGKDKGGKTQQSGAGTGKGDRRKDDKQTVCFYCGKTGHRKADCRQRAADLGRSQQQGKPQDRRATANALTESGEPESAPVSSLLLPERKSTSYVFALTTTESEPEPLPLCKLLMVDSCAAIHACPPTSGEATAAGKALPTQLEAANGAVVHSYGHRDHTLNLANGAKKRVQFVGCDVKHHMLSVSQLMSDWDADIHFLRHGQSHIALPDGSTLPLIRRQNVFWLQSADGEMLCPLG